MDIESKAFRIRTTATNPGRAEIVNKATGGAHFVPLDAVPSVHELGMMHEREFDRVLGRLCHHHTSF